MLEIFVSNNKESLDMIANGAYLQCYNKNSNLYYWQDDLKASAWERFIEKFDYIKNKFDLDKDSKIDVGLRWYIYTLMYHQMLQYIQDVISNTAGNHIRQMFEEKNLESGQILPIDDDSYYDDNNYEISDNRMNVRKKILDLLDGLDHMSGFSKNERLFIKVIKEYVENGRYTEMVKNRQTFVDELKKDEQLSHLKRKTLEIYLSRLSNLFKEVSNGKQSERYYGEFTSDIGF